MDRTMTDYNGPSVDPTSPSATLRATSELIRSGDLPTAERLLGWALDFNPEHAGLLRRMSELRWDEGKAEEAMGWAEQALAADSGDAENYAYLGLLCMRSGRYVEAADLVGRSIELKPDNPGYRRRLAEIMVNLSRGPDAIALASQAVSLRPQEVHYYHFLAGLQQRYGNFADAEATLLSALEVMPENLAVLRRLAELQLGQGNIASAHQWAKLARNVAPEDPANYDLEANLALISGDLTTAEDALRMATRLNPASSHHKRRLSDILMRRGDREGALAWAEKSIADHPRDLVGYNHFANMCVALGRHEEARAALEAAVAQAAKPGEAAPLMRRLSVLAQQYGRREEATGWAARAVAANPLDAANHDHLASVQLQSVRQKPLLNGRRGRSPLIQPTLRTMHIWQRC
jgi:tetratricopeptide (TPR) repeat protein